MWTCAPSTRTAACSSTTASARTSTPGARAAAARPRCCAATFSPAWSSYILGKMERGELSSVLFVGTGALMSPTSSQQGQAIPGVCHVVQLLAP